MSLLIKLGSSVALDVGGREVGAQTDCVWLCCEAASAAWEGLNKAFDVIVEVLCIWLHLWQLPRQL